MLSSTSDAVDLVETHVLPLLRDKTGPASIEVVAKSRLGGRADGAWTHILVALSPAIVPYRESLKRALATARAECSELNHAQVWENRSMPMAMKDGSTSMVKTDVIAIPRQPATPLNARSLFVQLSGGFAALAVGMGLVYWILLF